MQKKILGVSIDLRSEAAQNVQNILTKHGCIIKTRIGLHQQKENKCAEKGIVILELTDDCGENCKKLESDLSAIKNVLVREMEFDM